MFCLFIVLLGFSDTLGIDWAKYLFLNDKPCMVRPALISINLVELKCYPFMISLNKCTGCCNVLSSKLWVPKEAKAFNMITNKDEAKGKTKHISCGCKCKFNSTTCYSKQKWNHKACQYECKNYLKCKKPYRWNPHMYFWK